MIRIGICDDCKKDILWIQQCCEMFFGECKVEHEYEIFYSGEEVLEYCKGNKKKEERIDILFLDIEMGKISGIDLKCIWHIPTAGFAEQNGRNAKLNGRLPFDY